MDSGFLGPGVRLEVALQLLHMLCEQVSLSKHLGGVLEWTKLCIIVWNAAP